MSEELRQCEKCGSEPFIDGDWVCCSNSKCYYSDCCFDIETWQTRHPDPAVIRLVESCELLAKKEEWFIGDIINLRVRLLSLPPEYQPRDKEGE